MNRSRLPLPTLLSHALVAFTIEFDNEFERQLIGPTGLTFKAWRAGRRGVLPVSLAMWSNYLRFLPGDGVSVGELGRLARDSAAAIKSRLQGLQRWGYVVVEPDPTDSRAKPPYGDWIVRPRRGATACQEIWRPLAAVIEQRWQARFGTAEIRALRDQLRLITGRLDAGLPRYLPVVNSRRPMPFSSQLTPPLIPKPVPQPADELLPASQDPRVQSQLPLFALLAQVLLTFTVEFEHASDLALMVCANVLRVLDETGLPIRDLPQRSGVSKQAISQVLTLLTNQDYASVEPDPTAERGKQARLTPKGLAAQNAYHRCVNETEARWVVRFGTDEIGALRGSLEAMAGGGDLASSPLAAGLVAHDGAWRASVPTPALLPEQPMVLDRGAWPDGS